MNKCCRICWNTRYWREPTGEAAKLEKGDSYCRTYGFGHEEWLFNFSWLQPGPEGTTGQYRYGFLQPIGKYREAYEGKTFDVLLYTLAPDARRMGVGIIRKLYVPPYDELKAAHAYMRSMGWLAEMRREANRLGADPAGLKASADAVINVRFRHTDVEFFEPWSVLPRDHVVYRNGHYQPFNWNGAVPSSAISEPSQTDGKKRSEDDRTRAPTDGSVYSPRHVKLQNALYDHLCSRFGKNAVHYERDFIDLQLHRGRSITLFEIKIAPTAKSCIRQAIGQLLEYDLYPDRKRNSRLIVVGDGQPTSNDFAYLEHLRGQFRIPIFYHRWNWDRGLLEGDL
ncbi:hypothetical protein JQ561_34275 [Bradyrhizobium diazoefficiens]|nr:hypothetical protein [Bradyrhizobium diazoefficiens]MBR0931705.1 hypothetical protein [Bradyrhizobium diazoefficiens]